MNPIKFMFMSSSDLVCIVKITNSHISIPKLVGQKECAKQGTFYRKGFGQKR